MPEVSASSSVFGEARSLLIFIRRFARLAGPYWVSGETRKEKLKIHARLAALVALTVSQVFMPIWINQWNADFFNALEKRSWTNFIAEVEVLFAIMGANVAITSAHMWFKRELQIGWRTWLTDRMLGDWLSDGHQQQVNYLPGEHDNPDGRIAEDIRNVTEVAIELAHSLFYSTLLLIGFTQILWSLSGEVAVTVAGVSFTVYGHLVFIALLYSVVFSSLALWFSRPLVVAATRRQATEAKFRFELGRARENSETIALLHGEPNERRRFRSLFRGVGIVWRAQSWALTKMLMFLSGYSVISTAVPLLVAAPRYISGALSLGSLMQTAQAFQQMIQALSWPVDNSTKVAEWRGYGERVLGLHDALENLRQYKADPSSKIVVAESDRPVLAFRHVCIAMPDGRAVLANLNEEIQQGERVLISGDDEAVEKVFKVVGRQWPWGIGRVELPVHEKIFFLPRKPYVPKGSLRAVVSYPTPSRSIDDVALAAALERVGLGPLAQRFDDSAPWDQLLTRSELWRLGFARILLHKPRWIFIQEATNALDSTEEAAMMRILLQELPVASVICIGSRTDLGPFHDRLIHLGHTKISQILLPGQEGVQCGCVVAGVSER